VVLGLSVQALREGGAVVSKNVYVDLSKDRLLFLVVIQEIYTENPVMSTNNSVTSSLDSDKIVSTLKNGGS
jgi:hypothetical protein